MGWNRVFEMAGAVLALSCFPVSCSLERQEASDYSSGNVELVFRDVQTRTSLNAERTLLSWCDGDALSVLNDVDNANRKVICSSESSVSVDVPDAAEKLYALYPYGEDAVNGPAEVPVCVPDVQTQAAPGQMNGGCFPLAGSAAIVGSRAEFQFSPLASSIALVIYNTALEGDENVYSVKLTPTMNTGFAGKATLDLTGAAAFTEGDSSSPVSLALESPLSLLSSKPQTPGTYEGQLFVTLARQVYTRVKFEIATDRRTYSLESNDKSIDLTSCDLKILGIDLGKGKIFIEGSVSHEGFEEEGSDITEEGSMLESPTVIDRIMDDLDHDIIPDFSRVGYKYGDEDFPDYANVVNVAAPTGGDDTELIQNAIDSAPELSVVQLSAGTYRTSGIIFLDRDRIILRGSPEGSVIVSTSRNKQPVINFGKTVDRAVSVSTETVTYNSGGSVDINTVTVTAPSVVYSSSSSIVEDYVPVGRMYVKVSRPELFNVGDRVVVYRPGTSEWIHDIKMDQIPNHDGKQQQWNPKNYNLEWERIVSGIIGDRIYLDNPIVMALDRTYGGGSLRKISRSKIFFSGIENLTLDCEFDDSINGAPYYNLCDESHAWWGVRIRCAEHCWVRGVTTRHMGYGSVEIGLGSKNVTVDDCHSLSPISKVDGSRRYAFQFVSSTACIYSNCTCEADRHQFVTTSRNPGPDVFYNCTSTSSYSEAGPHQRWATGVLYDNVNVDAPLAVIDGEWCGSGHGWRGANFVLWNCTASIIAVQSPWVSAKNYAVGCIAEKARSIRGYQTLGDTRYDGEWFPERDFGSVGGSHVSLPYTGPDKPVWFPVINGGSFTHPESLYLTQLEDRHNRGIYLTGLLR